MGSLRALRSGIRHSVGTAASRPRSPAKTCASVARGPPSKVMAAMCQGPRSTAMFGSDRLDDARDECVRLLLESGADSFQVPLAWRPVVSRIIREHAQLAREPQLLNEAVVGAAIARQQDQKLRDIA
ncbi:hypothetical protein FOA52_014751 [Chlamydomonas sp. UWO 241]|nr:hypothetical protein FOA52_014751 [Chlamydomonas sp. UWO 241]